MRISTEGIRLQAMDDSEISAEPAEKAIVASLKRTLGFPEAKP